MWAEKGADHVFFYCPTLCLPTCTLNFTVAAFVWYLLAIMLYERIPCEMVLSL